MPLTNRDLVRLVNTNLPEFPEITDETVTNCLNYEINGDMRLSLGRFMTNQEYEVYRNKILSRPLP